LIEIRSLETIFKKELGWHGARINFLSNFVSALLKVKTICLTEIATAFTGNAKKESKYKRLQRFFKSFELDYRQIAILLAQMLPIKNESWVLSMDRTNWKLGKLNINVIFIGVAYIGISFPLFWVSLPKRGNSNTDERKDIIDKFLSVFGIAKIKCLTADREFIGYEWFSYLIGKNINFCIRIKEGFKVISSKGNEVAVKVLFRNLKRGESSILSGKRLICGVKLFIIALRLENGEYVILVTNKKPELAIEYYKMRWEIETLFACLKTRGFNFESTHITKLDRINKLVALLAITFCWCHIVGEWLNEQKPIKIKKHGRKAISIFRYGFDCLREVIFNLSRNIAKFKKLIRLLEYQISKGASLLLLCTQNFLSCT